MASGLHLGLDITGSSSADADLLSNSGFSTPGPPHYLHLHEEGLNLSYLGEGYTANHLKGAGKHPGTGEEPLNWAGSRLLLEDGNPGPELATPQGEGCQGSAIKG